MIGRKSTNEVNICLFVDALDEHDGNHRELILILRSIAQLTANPVFRVRLALAGRPENVFKTAFQDCPGFSIHEFTTDDIRHYAEDRIKADMPGELSMAYEEGIRNLVEKIVGEAQGVFLWVRLVVNEIVEGICEGDTTEELMTLLSTIPTELGELYKRALCRSSRSSLEAFERNRTEAYVMFQLATYARVPFYIDDFLTATYFLTAGRGTYPDLQRLSSEQMERRLNSRSAGLLEASRKGQGPVQFIHQTVKEFVTAGDGKIVIREGLSDRRLESGYGLIFRYILKQFENFAADFLDPDTQMFATWNFVYYAIELEDSEEKCVADSFEAIILRLPMQLQVGILSRIVDAFYQDRPMVVRAPASSHFHRNSRTRFCLFYLLCSLPLSLKKSLAPHKASMSRSECYTLLRAALLVKHHPYGSAEVLQTLAEEDGVARFLEKGHVENMACDKDELNDMLSLIRENLPDRKRSNSFSTPNEEGSEGESEEEQIGADPMELVVQDRVNN